MLGAKVGSYKMDESLSWEERYRKLEEHHIKETTFLIDLLQRWGKTVKGLDEMLTNEQQIRESLEKELEDKARL